jgi:hypothetical protein
MLDALARLSERDLRRLQVRGATGDPFVAFVTRLATHELSRRHGAVESMPEYDGARRHGTAAAKAASAAAWAHGHCELGRLFQAVGVYINRHHTDARAARELFAAEGNP